VKTPLIRRNPNLAQEVQDLLRPILGIDSVMINPVTGSIVIHYDSKQVRSKEILDILKQAGYFDPSKALTNDQYVHAAISKTGGVVWKALFGAFVEQALEGSALSVLAILI
jgi:hypothetical protein